MSVAVAALIASPLAAQTSFTLAQVKGYPFPTGLTAAATGSRIAWAFDERGARNVWVAEGPAFTPRKLTAWDADEGQEITSLSVSADGRRVVFIRGGDWSSNWDDEQPVNPRALPLPPKVGIWSFPFDGGAGVFIGEGEDPVISPRGDVVAFVRGGHIWVSPLDGALPRRIIAVRGTNGNPVWSPDGSRLAFVSGRGDHAFIGIYTDSATPITWIAPSTGRDASPRWSPDGRRIAFVRRPGSGGTPDSVLPRAHVPWSIWTADVATGAATRLWEAPRTLRGSLPTTHGGTNLHWAAGDRIVFLSYHDGWPHLYSVPSSGGEPLLLTPGSFMAEHITLSRDGRWLTFSANTGPDALDVDRRHVVRLPVDRAAPRVMTPGVGLEWMPVVTGDGATLAYISADARRPPLPTVMPIDGGAARTVAADRIPADFPTAQLVVPRQVTFRAADGTLVHGQLFERAGGAARKPAIVYIHGGPPRQMLLGWHYSDYYANAYALNQYLASRGHVVLSVNYRLGIGYGHEFHNPDAGGARGASEYQDVRAAGEFLRALPQVDARRIGVYGGSYGGFLTAMALARDSDLFATGVDIHGVHDFSGERSRPLLVRERYERAADADSALTVAWRSSPIAYVGTWRSPVLLIHADDDRNVRFSQTVDLVQRLRAARVPFEEVVIVDDTHHFMRFANQQRVNQTTADWFDRMLRP